MAPVPTEAPWDVGDGLLDLGDVVLLLKGVAGNLPIYTLLPPKECEHCGQEIH